MTKTARGWWAPAIGAGLILGVLVGGAGLAVTGHIDHDKYGWRWPAAIGATALLAAVLMVLAAVLRERGNRRVRQAAEAASAAAAASPVPGFEPPAGSTAPAPSAVPGQPTVSEPPTVAGSPAEPGNGRVRDSARARFAATVPSAAPDRRVTAAVPEGQRLPEWAGPTWGGEVRPSAPRRPAEPEPAGTPVRGYVRDAADSVVAGAAVTLIDLSGQQTGRCVTGVDGWYQVPAPRPGTYTLIVRARGHQPSASVVAVGGAPVELDLTLVGTAVLTGTVRIAGGVGTVPGATVSLVDGSGEVLAAGAADDTAGYRFAELLAGGYTVVVHAPGYRPAAVPVTVPETGTVGLDVALIGGASVLGTARAGRDDRPLPDALVTLYDARGERAAEVATDGEGRYRIDDLAAGEYTVVAAGFPAVTADVHLVDGEQYEHDVVLSHDPTTARSA